MYSINNKDLNNTDASIDLPNDLKYNKRRFTLNISSDGFEQNLTDGKTFYKGNVVPINFENSSIALNYNLPMPLKSKSGFFNISLRSFCIGSNNLNSVYSDVAGESESYVPYQSNLLVNIKASSPYNCSIKDNLKDVEIDLPIELVSNYPDLISRTEQLVGGCIPIGSVQIYNSNGDNHIEGQGAGQQTHSFNVPFIYPTKCDDYSITVPDSIFNTGNLTIVLSSPCHLWFDGVNQDFTKVVKTDIPLLLNTTAPEDALTASLLSYRPFNLPYNLTLSLEEA
jgi:hypothetical protein